MTVLMVPTELWPQLTYRKVSVKAPMVATRTKLDKSPFAAANDVVPMLPAVATSSYAFVDSHSFSLRYEVSLSGQS